MTEIRSAFLATETQAERIKRFREERIGRIIADETPVVLSSPHRLVLHIVPLPSFFDRQRLDLTDQSSLSTNFPPIYSSGGNHRYNLDGYLTWKPERREGEGVDSYCQLFFDGTVEAVFSDLLKDEEGRSVGGGTGLIASVAYEQYTIKAVRPAPARVVDAEHVYYVAHLRLLTHNNHCAPRGRQPRPTVDPVTGQPVQRFIGTRQGPAMIEPRGGSTSRYPTPTSPDTHTYYPNGSNYQRLQPDRTSQQPDAARPRSLTWNRTRQKRATSLARYFGQHRAIE